MSDHPTRPRPGPPDAGDEARERLAAVRAEVAKAVVGQDAAVSGLLVALLCGGHVLMEGVPGVAKTLLVRTPRGARSSVDTRRVQFTPDLMPGDITGSMVIDSAPGRADASARGRSSPTCCWPTRSTGPRRRPSPRCWRRWRRARSRSTASPTRCRAPFLVAATQNPVEYEGTYPLPEAQLDRFLLKVVLPVPERDGGAARSLRRHAAGFDPRDVAARRGHGRSPAPPTSRPGGAAVRRVQVSPEVAGYIVDIARATRAVAVARASASARAARPRCCARRGPGPG